MVSILTRSLPAIIIALMLPVAPISAQPAESNVEKGSLTNPAKAGSLAAPPAAGSISTGRPAAGSITTGRPAAGSISVGRPAAGSMSSGVGAGALSVPIGSQNVTGTLAEQRRNLNRSSITTSTRSERPERPRRVLRRD